MPNKDKKHPLARNAIWISIAVIATFVWLVTPSDSVFKRASAWQQMAEPGRLSAAHSSLENNCAACHTSVIGVDTAKCIVCHANDESILQRQPTAFHANVGTCKLCHLEHRGLDASLSEMDHAQLTKIGMRVMSHADRGTEQRFAHSALSERLRHGVAPHDRISLQESVLDCASCHSHDDPHQKLFGHDCTQCHATDRWTIPEYKHPSPKSNDCSQCHQAPPSHYMMHFKMISARVAGKPHARVDQCNQCHQTTSWNDIKRVGWYKHH